MIYLRLKKNIFRRKMWDTSCNKNNNNIVYIMCFKRELKYQTNKT